MIQPYNEVINVNIFSAKKKVALKNRATPCLTIKPTDTDKNATVFFCTR
jgi:hypothetical protein